MTTVKTEENYHSLEKDISNDRYEYHTESLPEAILVNKKNNVRYWDAIDDITEDYVTAMCKFGGINLNAIHDLSIVKEVVEQVQAKLSAEFPEILFPFVNKDY